MVMFVPGLSNRSISPGAPAPITFGMNTANDWMNNQSESLSLNPGIGNPGSGRSGFLGGPSGDPGGGGGALSGQGQPTQSAPGVAASGQAQSAQNLAPVNVQAYAPPSLGLSMLGSLYSDSPSGQSSIASPSVDGVKVKNLAPTNVQAQMPVNPGLFGSYNQWYNDHRFLGGLAEGLASAAVPMLKPVFVAAHAYYNSQHGQPLFGPLWGRIANAFSGLGDGPGSPLSSSPNSPLFASLYDASGAGSGADYNGSAPGYGIGGMPTIASSGALPAYPGLSALSGGSAPLGGFWNQRALHDAAPVYGPYAGFNYNPTSPVPAGGMFAPAGITGA